MSKDTQIEIDVLTSLSQIPETEWDRCACPEAVGRAPFDPFTTYRFLKALEDSQSVGPGTGWTPHYLQAKRGDDTIGVAPLYGKSHSQGEYIFDHNFAQAYENSGGRYYPKLQMPCHIHQPPDAGCLCALSIRRSLNPPWCKPP